MADALGHAVSAAAAQSPSPPPMPPAPEPEPEDKLRKLTEAEQCAAIDPRPTAPIPLGGLPETVGLHPGLDPAPSIRRPPELSHATVTGAGPTLRAPDTPAAA